VTRVLGVDPSLTAAGIALIEDGAVVHLGKRGRGGRRGETLTQRGERIFDIATHVLRLAHGVDLLVIERPVGGPGGSTWDRAGLWWAIVQPLVVLGGPVVVDVVPQHAKMLATGKGSASKTEVGVAMSRLWSDVDPTGRDDNEWDALALAHLGAARLGLDVPTRAHHQGVLDRITWPDNLPDPQAPGWLDAARNSALDTP